MQRPPPIISVADLQARMLRHSPLCIVDCRFNLLEPDAGRAAYQHAHIPGSVYASLDADLSAQPGEGEGRHPLPSQQTFSQTLQRLGISQATPVVVYDDQDGGIAARLWWMLRSLGHQEVLLLDGGWRAWQAAKLSTEPGNGLIDSAVPAAAVAPHRVNAASFADTVACEDIMAIDFDSTVLLDARAAVRFAGIQEPIDPVAGHIPGAINWPFNENLDDKGCFLSPDKIRLGLERRLSDAQKRADPATLNYIAMCGSGVTACHILIALQMIGLSGRLYVGSWSQWIRDPNRPIIKR